MTTELRHTDPTPEGHTIVRTINANGTTYIAAEDAPEQSPFRICVLDRA